jgi:ribonuclease VapC
MVLDTSVVVAVMQHEEGFELLISRIGEALTREISAVSYMEASMVLIGKRGEGAEADLDRMLYEAEIAIVPVSVTQAKIAREAFRKYGKGRNPAGLNFGDCFSYALARAHGLPLLFKGNDFSQTDVLQA